MLRSLALISLLCAAGAAGAAPWTYRGTLNDGGRPANGRYDLRLTLRHDGKAYVAPLTVYGVEVRDGAFAAEVELPLEPEYAPLLALETDVAQAGGAFEPLGAPIPFDAKSALAGVCWDTGGNTGTNPATDFLGTTDAQPLVLRTRNAQSLRIEPSSVLVAGSTPITTNLVAGSSANSVSAGVRGATISGGGVPAGDTDPSYTSEAPNIVADHYGTVGGGYGNRAGSALNGNVADQPFATVGGGLANTAGGRGATVGGGGSNSAGGLSSTIGGGQTNFAGDFADTVGGGDSNTANGIWSTVAGGRTNIASGGAGSVGGGESNAASGGWSSVAGGNSNSASGGYSAVAGGRSNTASGLHSVVAGGFNSFAINDQAVVGGGFQNLAGGSSSTVAGGATNSSAGRFSTVPGGGSNCAGGDYSFAAGRGARIRHGNEAGDGECGASSGDSDGDNGTFVWSDDNATQFFSSGPNQFLVRAGGGFALNTRPPAAGDVEMTVQSSATAGPDFANLWLKQRNANNNGILLSVGDGNGSNDAGFYIDQYNGSAQTRRFELAPSGAVTIRSNVTQANTGVTLAANGGAWTSLSDRRLKTAIEAVDPGAILERVVALPISTWSYIAQGTGIRHIGPMAQDFKAAFEVGESDTGITTIDADGVALAAIQGLNRKLETENAELRARLEALEARLEDGR